MHPCRPRLPGHDRAAAQRQGHDGQGDRSEQEPPPCRCGAPAAGLGIEIARARPPGYPRPDDQGSDDQSKDEVVARRRRRGGAGDGERHEHGDRARHRRTCGEHQQQERRSHDSHHPQRIGDGRDGQPTAERSDAAWPLGQPLANHHDSPGHRDVGVVAQCEITGSTEAGEVGAPRGEARHGTTGGEQE